MTRIYANNKEWKLIGIAIAFRALLSHDEIFCADFNNFGHRTDHEFCIEIASSESF